MSSKSSRFGAFLKPSDDSAPDEVAAEPTSTPLLSVPAPEPAAYLLRRFPRDEALARLGNGVRASSKHHLEDYVRELKRGGWPATEARVMEALFELLDLDPAFRPRRRTT
jgi:hypothetical protein